MAVDEKNPWMETFQKLPPDAQGRVQAWLGTQMFIARELGLEKEAWLKYVEWALAHPFDLRFLGEEGVNLLANTADGVVDAEAEKARAAAVGARPAAPTGALTNPAAPVEGARRAGLSNIHMLGAALDEKKKKK